MDKPRTAYRTGKTNNKFQQFADDYGFEVRPCIAGRPRTKAKVEAPMKLLDEVLAYNGTLNFEELHALVDRINNRVNATCHPTTGKIPILHLEKEKDFLHLLPSKQVRSLYRIQTTQVKVNSQSMFSYKSNLYSVPAEYIGKHVKLQVYAEQIHVYFNTNLVAIHRVSTQKLNYHQAHYQEITAMTMNYKNKSEIDALVKNNLNLIGAFYKNE